MQDTHFRSPMFRFLPIRLSLEIGVRRTSPKNIRARHQASGCETAFRRRVARTTASGRGPATNKSIVEIVIARLREYGYLDDEKFAIQLRVFES